MVDLTYYDDWYRRAPHIHKSVGLLLFFFTIMRFVWIWGAGKPDAIAEHSEVEKRLGKIVHLVLYLLLFLIFFSGYLISTADGRSIEVFDWFEVPAVFSEKGQEELAGKIHFILAVSLMILVCAHMIAALKHHFIDKDKTLSRMFGKF